MVSIASHPENPMSMQDNHPFAGSPVSTAVGQVDDLPNTGF